MPLNESLSDFWRRLQGELFPALTEEPGPEPLSERHRQLVQGAVATALHSYA